MATPAQLAKTFMLTAASMGALLLAETRLARGQDFQRLPALSEVVEAGWLEEEGGSQEGFTLELGQGPVGPLASPGILELNSSESSFNGPAEVPLDGLPGAMLRRGLWNEIYLDHVHFYSWTTLKRTVPVVAGAAALANTPADVQIRDWWQAHRDPGLEGFWDGAKQLGEGKWMVPLCLSAWVAGECMSAEDSSHWLGQWGGRATRGYLVGFPMLLTSQLIVGASRPYDGDGGSGWSPFADDNGVSGHAFMGAMPFLTAANMCESPWAKALCYAGSAITPLSRIEHDAHFASQVILGWWLAYMASGAVDTTINSFGPWSIEPMPVRDGVGMMFTWQH